MSIDVTFPFDSAANYTLVGCEVSGGKARLLDLRTPDLKFLATYSVDEDAEIFVGSGVGTLSNGAVVAASALDLRPGTAAARCDYPASNSNAILGNVACVRVRVIPDYSGAPPSDSYFFGAGVAVGNVDSIEAYHRSAGGAPEQVLFFLYDGAGATIFAGTTGTWSPVIGTEYELEFNYDATLGILRIFIDGALHYENLAITPGVRTGTNDRFKVGNTKSSTNRYRGQVTGFAMFDAMQHTAPYTPNAIGSELVPPKYASGTVLTNAALQTEIALSFGATHVDNGGTTLFAFDVGGQLRYWNGGAWANSDGSIGQLNDAATLDANAPTLLPAISLVKMFARLDGSAGLDNLTPELDEITYSYDYGAIAPGALPQCEVFGFIRDLQDNPVVGATITAIFEASDKYQEVSAIVMETGDSVSVVTDADGRFDLDLVQGADVRLEIVMPNLTVKRNRQNDYLYFTVPALDFVDISTLLD